MGCTVFINNFCGALKPTLAQSRCYYVIFWLPLSLSRDDGIYNWTSPYHGVQHNHSWYLSQPPQPAVVFSFRTRAFFCTENAKFWPLLAYEGYFVANLRTFWCTFTGLNNVVVSQNWQISGTYERKAVTPHLPTEWKICQVMESHMQPFSNVSPRTIRQLGSRDIEMMFRKSLYSVHIKNHPQNLTFRWLTSNEKSHKITCFCVFMYNSIWLHLIPLVFDGGKGFCKVCKNVHRCDFAPRWEWS